MSSLSVFLLEILLNIGPKWRPFWKPRWRPKTGRTNLLPSKFLYRMISTICVPKFTILSRSAHFISYIDLRAPTKKVPACWRYGHDALNQSWVNVGPPSVTLAHIQCGVKTRHGKPILGWCWLNVTDGGPIIARHRVNVSTQNVNLEHRRLTKSIKKT